jgi:hypothetical protein
MGSAVTARLRPGLLPAVALAISLLMGEAVTSPHLAEVLLLLGSVAVVAATLLLPPHLFVGATLVVLGTNSVSEEHPFHAGPMTIYTTDLILGLLIVRGVFTRPRNRLPALSMPVKATLVLWGAVSLIAGVRGHSAGNSVGQIGRYETSFVYLTVFGWGYMRVMAESRSSLPRMVKVIAITGIGFILYALYTRITHQRFSGASGAGVGNVTTAAGVLRRDYGLLSAFQLYPLLALGALAYLLSAPRPGRWATIVMGAAAAATLLTLVRGLIFGLAAAAALLLVWAIRERRPGLNLGGRLTPIIVLTVFSAIVFSVLTPHTAYGVADRVLPGLLPQTANANSNTQFRKQVLVASVRLADQHPLGIGFVSDQQMTEDAYPPLYIAHSQWGSLLAFEGWPGLLAFVWLMIAVIRRSRRLPVAHPWLHRLLVASAVVMVVQGLAWNVLFTLVSGMGMFALIVALRFGITAAEEAADTGMGTG